MDGANVSRLPTALDQALSFPAAVPASPGSGEISLGDLLRQLWRRKSIILSTIVLVTLLVTIIVFQLTPYYTVTSKVMITAQQPHIVKMEEVVASLDTDKEAIQSEVQVLTSRGLAEKVVNKLDLVLNPEFNPALHAPSWFSFNPISYLPPAWREAIFGAPVTGEPTEEELGERELVAVVDNLLSKLEVWPEGDSRAISISITAADPETAALVANTFADLYLVEQLDAKLDATRRATEWLSEQVRALRAKVEASETAVERFRKEAGLIQGEDATTVTAQQISELNTQLILARTERAESEARLRNVEALVHSPQGVASAAEVLSSELIQRLREQEAEVQRKLGEYASEFGPRHPRIINLRAEAERLQTKIQAEIGKIADQVRNEAMVARVRERTLEENLKQLEQKAAQLNSSAVQLRALEREAEANRSLFSSLLSRMKETTAQEDLQQANARLLSRAVVPTVPSFPKKKLFVLVGFIASVLLGVMLALLVESLDKGFRSSEQVENMLGTMALGLVPLFSALQKRRRAPEGYVLEHPTSAYAEAMRSLHMGLILSDVDKPPKVVLITSAVPNEGKTSLSVSLARLMAKSGQKVLLVDADLRHPRVHKALGLASRPGLVESLMDNTLSIDDILQIDEASGLHVLAAGSSMPNAPELLGSRRMQQEIQGLARTYDLVILDSPPVLSVSDARVLSRIADRTVFVIRWAETRREVAMRGLKQIRDAGGHLAGVVLSMVDVRKHARYGYSDSGYYVGASRRYYTD